MVTKQQCGYCHIVEVLFEERWNFRFFRVAERFELEVLCGTSAVYTVRIALNEEERANYEEHGEAFVHRLAQRVRDRPQDYAERHRHRQHTT